ncbi:MAG: hypothetical protein HRU69_02580 [Flammeovirgaceae bacterium]|nr:MAG: hypothetical protein HRU69_02580 [Flammeovirgaceae bacterium]
MRKDWKYIAYLLAAVAVYLIVKMVSPREIDWTITFYHKDKNPHGTYALNELMPNLFQGKKIYLSNLTVYEWYDSVNTPVNFISFSTTFKPGKEDVESLLRNIHEGGTAFIAAQYFDGTFADTLNLGTSDYFFDSSFSDMFNRNDSSYLEFTNPDLPALEKNVFPRKNIHNYFSSFDSTRTQVIAVNDLDLPVTLKITWGKGSLYVNSTPLVFTNVYLLQGSNYQFIERSLSHLPVADTYWTEFYHLGRMEAATPLRFILSNEPLAWAYYVSIAALLLFILFEIKRTQRVIPVIKPLGNSTLEFVRTIGNLYYQSADHKNIAEKRIAFFIDQLRNKHNIKMHHLSDDLVHTISSKTGNSLEEVNILAKQIQIIQNKPAITADELTALSKKLDSFNL